MKNSGKKIIIIVLIILLVVGLVIGGIYCYKKNNSKPITNNETNKINENTKSIMKSKNTSSYTNTMSFDLYKDADYIDYYFYKVGSEKDKDLEFIGTINIKIEGKEEDIVIYNYNYLYSDYIYESNIGRYLLYKDNNKIKAYDAHTKESYILDVPVGEDYQLYILEKNFDLDDAIFVEVYNNKEDYEAKQGVLIQIIDYYNESSEPEKPFGVLDIKNNKYYDKVYNIDYEYGHILYLNNDKMEAYDWEKGSSKAVNIPVSYGNNELGFCKGEYDNYIICNYGSSYGKNMIFYNPVLYSYTMNKIIYKDKYEYIDHIAYNYFIGVKYKCEYTGNSRDCNGKTVDIIDGDREKVYASIRIDKYKESGFTIENYDNKYFCLLKETMDGNNCIATFAYYNDLKTLVLGETQGTKVNKDGNLCILKNKTLTIYDENGKVVSTAKNKKLSDCK